MGGSDRVWRVCTFMIQTQPDPIKKKKKKIVTQPNPPSPKNQPNPVGRVGSGRFWPIDGFFTHPYLKKISKIRLMKLSCSSLICGWT